MIWAIRYFFITAGTGGLRYEFCFRSFKLTERTAKIGYETCIASRKAGDGVNGGFPQQKKTLRYNGSTARRGSPFLGEAKITVVN